MSVVSLSDSFGNFGLCEGGEIKQLSSADAGAGFCLNRRRVRLKDWLSVLVGGGGSDMFLISRRRCTYLEFERGLGNMDRDLLRWRPKCAA